MPCIMGIINVTPDSFSDGGQHHDPRAAIAHALRLVTEGADVLDIGGESTRPGSMPVEGLEQIQRIVPVIAGLRAEGINIPISVDTRSAAVAKAALRAGANIVNDVSALRDDPNMARVCSEAGAGLVLMHMLGAPATMQHAPQYDDVAGDVAMFLLERAALAQACGLPRAAIVIDPGIGFGKSAAHNLRLLSNLNHLCGQGYPVLIGASRKRLLGEIIGEADPTRRDHATAVVSAWCMSAGVAMVRVHDVKSTRQALQVWSALTTGNSQPGHTTE